MNGSVNGNMFIIVDTPLVDGLRSNKNPKNKNKNNIQECSFYSPPSLSLPLLPGHDFSSAVMDILADSTLFSLSALE